MRRTIALLAFLQSCTPARAPSPGAMCHGKPWYPGVTDKNAPRTTVVFEFNDRSPKDWTPDDICILVDDRTMLTSDHRNVVLPRLRETVTWRGTLAPGKHTVEVHVRTSSPGQEPRAISSTHVFDIGGETTIEARIQDDLATHWYTAKGVPFLVTKTESPEPEPVASSSARPYLPPTWFTAPSDAGTD